MFKVACLVCKKDEQESPGKGGLAAQPMPVLLTHAEHGLQVFKNASHALLQEADVNLAQLMKDVGFYVTQRHMSAPVTKRSKSSFGSASPIEKPTIGELDYYSEG